ncbi:hypothetical protein ACXVUM_13150 [Williamsia sp. SKLECPSW1]
MAKGVGGGGTLRRADAAVASIPAPVAEAALYDPLLSTLEGAWASKRMLTPLVCEATAFGGSRQTGGRWSRPDLVVIGFRRFELVPARFEVVTFEVKTASNVNVMAVYESLSHSRAATHAYVIFHIPRVLSTARSGELDAAIAVAAEHGIGVITAENPSDFSTWKEPQSAGLLPSDPARMNEFLHRQVSSAGRRVLAAEVARHDGNLSKGSLSDP